MSRLRYLITFQLLVALLPLAVEASETSDCAIYQTGETRQFDLVIPSNHQHSSYSVTKLNDRKYMISLNLDLGANRELRSRIHSCFQNYNANNAQDAGIALHLWESTDHEPAPTAHRIKIEAKLDRENMDTYAVNSTCATLIHESLHVAGLVDEYKETVISTSNYQLFGGYINIGLGYDDEGALRGKPTAFDCRSLSDSFMSGAAVRRDDSMRKTTLGGPSITTVCACDSRLSQQACDEMKAAYNSKHSYENSITSCPSGTTLISQRHDLEDDAGDAFFGIVYSQGLQGFKPNRLMAGSSHNLIALPSALKPAHIRQLLFPKCDAINHVYRQCTLNAYETSVAHGGTGCISVPKICSEFNRWLD